MYYVGSLVFNFTFLKFWLCFCFRGRSPRREIYLGGQEKVKQIKVSYDSIWNTYTPPTSPDTKNTSWCILILILNLSKMKQLYFSMNFNSREETSNFQSKMNSSKSTNWTKKPSDDCRKPYDCMSWSINIWNGT